MNISLTMVSPGDKHRVENISANFRNNLKWPKGHSGGRRKLIRERTVVENLVSDSL